MRILAVCFVLLLEIPAALRAQRAVAPVRGTVVDSAGHAIESVEVTASTVGRVTRTSSAGHFEIDTLVSGPNRILVRRLGWKAIDTTFMLDAAHPPTFRFVMAPVAQNLNEIRIVSQDECPSKTLEGFNCRRHAGIGAFRDSAEIAALDPTCFANILQGMDGIRLLPGRPCARLQSTKGWRCLRVLVDGQLPEPEGRRAMSDFIGVEFYDEEDKIPEWYKMYAFAQSRPITFYRPRFSTASPGRSCALIVYWTRSAVRYDPSLDQNPGVTRVMQAHRDSANRDLFDSLTRKKP